MMEDNLMHCSFCGKPLAGRIKMLASYNGDAWHDGGFSWSHRIGFFAFACDECYPYLVVECKRNSSSVKPEWQG